MKKIAGIAILFIIIAAAVFVWKFPYAEYVEKAVRELNSGKDVNISWAGSENKFPNVIFKDVSISTSQGSAADFDTLKVQGGICGDLKFDGKGKDDFTLNGTMKNGNINFNIKNYRLPSYIASMSGEGNFNFNGNYNIRTKQGLINFTGTILKIPHSVINIPLSLTGKADINGDQTDISFDASGDKIKGTGNAVIKGKAIDGKVRIDTGIIPINVKISGEVDSIKIKV